MPEDQIVDPEEFLGLIEEESPGPTVSAPVPTQASSEGVSIDEFLDATGLASSERVFRDIQRPWMKHHNFVLVRSADELDEIITKAIAAKKCALDLETTGLDSRIFYTADGKPYTKDQIVGACLSIDGLTGYYAPVRHDLDDGGPNFNIPVDRFEAAMARLCQAAQPKPKPGAEIIDPLSYKDWIEPGLLVLYFWNGKFDQEFLYPATGIDWWHPDSFEDGYLACYSVFSDDRHLSLKWKAFDTLRDVEGNPYEMIELKELFAKGRKIEFNKLSPDEPGCLKYACSDAICTFLLCESPRKTDKREDYMALARTKFNLTYKLEKQTAQAVRWMERPRVRLNRDRIVKLRDDNIAKRDAILSQIVGVAHQRGYEEFDPKSSKSLGEFLFGDRWLNLSPKTEKNEKSGQYKTDADSLERLMDENPGMPEILRQIVEWRKYEKLDSTYYQNMVNNLNHEKLTTAERAQADCEMRFQFKQTGAATGRFSAPAGEADQGFSGIPIHGIPATSDLRKCFEAREGYTMVKADYAGEELRIAANVSGEMVWIKEFLEGDGDLHSITARAFFGKQQVSKEERKMGKIANFALLYGGGPASIMRATGCDKMEAIRRKNAFDKAVPGFAKWIKGQHERVRKDKGVWTAFRRWVAIPDVGIMDKAVIASCERKSTNFPIQGSGADIMKISLVKLCKEFYKRKWLKQGGGSDSVRMLLTVHDEIVFEIKHALVQEAIELIVEVMASPGQMAGWRVPLVVEPLIGETWGGEYDYGMLMHGKPFKGEPLKSLEVQVEDRVYHKVPPWLEGLFIPGWQKKGAHAPASEVTPDVSVPLDEAAAEDVSIDDIVPVAEQPKVEHTVAAAPAPKPIAPAKTEVVVGTSVFTLKLSILSKQTVAQLRGACGMAYDPDAGKVLCLIDSMGHTLIEPSLGVRVMPEVLAQELKRLNLSDGVVYPYPHSK